MSTEQKTFKLSDKEIAWDPAAENFKGADGVEYGSWSKVLKKDDHGLSMLVRFKAPTGKAWKVRAIAPALGEEVFLVEGAYYRQNGEVFADTGSYIFNAPHARHGAITPSAKIFVHWCSGLPDERLSLDLIDFEAK